MTQEIRLTVFKKLEEFAQADETKSFEVRPGCVLFFPNAPDYETCEQFYDSGWSVSSSVYSEDQFDRWDLASSLPFAIWFQPENGAISTKSELRHQNEKESSSQVPWKGRNEIWKGSGIYFEVNGKIFRTDSTGLPQECIGDLSDFGTDDWQELKSRYKKFS